MSKPLKRVLLIDDDIDVLMGLQLVLEEQFHVEVASQPNHALRMLEASVFDAIVVDLMMPAMDGARLIEHIRARKLSSAPIILMSAYPDAEVTAQLSGAADSICKPFDVEVLENKLHRLFDTKSFAGAFGTKMGKAL